MTILVHINGWPTAPWLEPVRRNSGGQRVITLEDTSHLAETRYALVWKPTPGLLASLPQLAVIFNLGAGVDAILADETIPKHLPIVRVVDPNLSGRMVEWVALHVLFHHRKMPLYLAQQQRREWVDTADQPAARDVTVGVMGLGEIGRSAVKALRALGFPVVGWSRSPRTVDSIETFSGVAGLDEFLGRTDILVSILPLTPETRGLLDLRLFRRLKRGGPLGGPVLLNCGRGPQQVEADIITALDEGTLVGASLDVFEREPLSADSPLWGHPKVVITPHNAADSEPESLSLYVTGQIARYERGEPLDNVVDRARGY